MNETTILQQAREAFLEESQDLLAQFEAALLTLAEAPDADSVNAAFRAAHTIKGSAGLFGFEAVVSFTHHVEALLDRVRDGDLVVSDALVTLMLESRDHIARLISQEADSEEALEHSAESERLTALLHRAAGTAAAPMALQTLACEPPANVSHDEVERTADNWLLHMRFALDTFAMGFDPLSFLRYLPTVGDVVHVAALLGAVPALDVLDAENCHLGCMLTLRSSSDKRRIEAVFDFVGDSIELQILPPTRKVQEMLALIEHFDDDQTKLGEMLVRVGAITRRELNEALAAQVAHVAQLAQDALLEQGSAGASDRGSSSAATTPPPLLGEKVIERQMAPPDVVQAAVARQAVLRDKRGDESRFVRVQADKLDALISLIGELVIAGSATRILADQRADVVLAASAARVCGLVEGARDRALQLRMVPIGETFSRFKRIVHDVGRSLGKDVDLVINGGEAELDKSMVEQIVDPLTHLVRNALDHGLETAANRLATGKPARGSLTLNAFHESGAIVIEVSDDGRGLARDRILAKAIERGLVKPGTELTDAEVHQLIFMPGFSTAEQVTDLSGRGVGMDVVRRNIEALRGEVSLTSAQGRGSTVRIRLPLTLAIIEGFRFEVARQQFVVPLDLVVECIESPAEVAQLDAGALGGCFNLRGEVLPLLCLRRHLGLQGPRAPLRSVLVMRCAGRKVGVVVDALLGEHQTVIKPLGRLFHKLRGISGSTILGTGSVALILDIPALVASADKPTHVQERFQERLQELPSRSPVLTVQPQPERAAVPL